MDLRPQMEFVVDEPDYGVLEVSRAWVAYVAAVPAGRAPDIAAAWAASMGEEHGEEIPVNAYLVTAVEELLMLCKAAESNQLPVLHVWQA